MKTTKLVVSHELTYGEEVSIWRQTGAAPIQDRTSESWTYVLPGVEISAPDIAGILSIAADHACEFEPPRFIIERPGDEGAAVRPVNYHVDFPVDEDGGDVALAENESVSKRVPGLDLDKINWDGKRPPTIPKKILTKLDVTAQRVSDVWENFPSPKERRAFFEIWVSCAD